MKGILFKEDMFKAVIEGCKTQTRRICKPQPGIDEFLSFDGYLLYLNSYSRYNEGELVYLKEPFYIDDEDGYLEYKYGYYDGNKWWDNPIIPFHNDIRGRWQNKLFMPACYARYFIKIKTIRLERLHEITWQDTLAEGVGRHITIKYPCWHKEIFGEKWSEINGKESWNDNPYVFVYEFILVNKNHNGEKTD